MHQKRAGQWLAVGGMSAVAGLALIVAAALGWRQWCETVAAMERGRLHFEGLTELKGRMAGHDQALPALATRCANCHLGTAPQPLNDANAISPLPAPPAPLAPLAPSTASGLGLAALSGAPSLGKLGLTSVQKRRGGPPSRYDSNSLCRLLQLGHDPAHVVISTNMPRYSITPPQCDDLWLYLNSK